MTSLSAKSAQTPRKSLTKKLIPLVIVLFWLGMMAWLAKKEFLAPQPPAKQATAARPIDTWMGVYVGGEKHVGFVHYSARPESQGHLPGTQIRLLAHLALAVLGPVVEIDVKGSAWVPESEGKGSVDLDISSGGEHSLSIDASIAAGILDGTMKTVGQTIPIHFSIGDTFHPTKGLGDTLNASGMEVGKEYVVDSFDPMSFSAAKLHIKCVAEETVNALGKAIPTKVLTMNSGGMATKMWISAKDEVIRAEIPLGFTLKISTPQEAMGPVSSEPAADLLSKSAIEPTGKPVTRGMHRMVVRVTGIESGAVIPSDDTQAYDRAGLLKIVARHEPSPALGIPEHDASFAQELAADPLIQSDAPEIRAQAQAIVGAETDRWKAATAIYQWVFESLDKKMVFSVPSALDVLKSKEGDCNEHTTLYVALARAVGIPARIAIGVVWSDEYKGFFYHAWPEVYVGAWTWIDPTLGQPVADATHIKLLNGNVDQWGKLLPFVGKAQLEVIETE